MAYRGAVVDSSLAYTLEVYMAPIPKDRTTTQCRAQQ